MDQEANPYRDPATPGQPPSSPPTRWRVPRSAVTVGLAAFLGLAGAGVAFAVTGPSGRTASSATGSLASGTSSTATPGGPPAGRHGMGRFGPHAGFGPMGAGVVHGVFTVRNGSGYRVEEVQTGVVQPGNSSTSITVNSADGYSQTYTVQPSTEVNSQAGGISTVKSGDRVRVEALQQGSGYTATDIVDMTQIGSSRQGFGFGPPAPPASGPTGSGQAPGDAVQPAGGAGTGTGGGSPT